jgi:hypothetical protein
MFSNCFRCSCFDLVYLICKSSGVNIGSIGSCNCDGGVDGNCCLLVIGAYSNAANVPFFLLPVSC